MEKQNKQNDLTKLTTTTPATTSTSRNVKSADQLIKNILEKVDTDAKISKFYNTHHQQQQLLNQNNTQQQLWTKPVENIPLAAATATNFYSPLVIPQCFYLHSEIPEIYLKIWQSVQCIDNNNIMAGTNQSEFCDRNRLYQILLKSNLSNDVLAKLWSFVNRTKPGELTRNELFVMLALVGLVQQSIPNPLQELYSIQTIPVPYFSDFSSVSQPSIVDEKPTIVLDSNLDSTNEDENHFDNEFCEFKSAEIDENQNISTIDPPQNLNANNSILPEDLLFEVSTPTSQELIQSNNDNEDEFGDFMQTEIVENFEKNSTNIKDHEDLFSISVNFNLQSDINENEDKYSHFRNIANDDFGDFHSQQPIDQKIHNDDEMTLTQKDVKTVDEKRIEIYEKILIAIKQVMHKTFNVLVVNHDENSVIEALSSNDGYTFANDLNQVFQIVERMKSTINKDDNVDDNMYKCRTLIDEIDRNWNSIHKLMIKASIVLLNCTRTELNEEFHENINENSNNNNEKCFICSTRIDFGYSSSNNNNNNNSNENKDADDDNINNSKHYSIINDSLRIDNGNGTTNTNNNDIAYHLSCANFWINFVDTTNLPHIFLL